MKSPIKFASLALAAAFAACAYGSSIDDVRTDVVPGEWTSNFTTAKAYAEANGIPMFVFFASSSCSHCSAVKTAINSAEFVAWRKSRKLIMVAVDDNATVKNFAKSAARWLQAEKTGKYPYMRIYWPAGGVDCGANGYPYASIPGSGSTTQARIMNMIDKQLASWISGGGSSGTGTGSVTPVTPVTPSEPVVGDEWNRSRILYGAYYLDGALAGRIQVTAGKVSKGQAKVKASIMGLDGRSKRFAAKKATVDSTTKGTLSAAAGTFNFTITGSTLGGTITSGGIVYTVTGDKTGGSLTAGTYTFSLEKYPTECQGYPVINPTEFLPLAQTFTSSALKWSFPRKATVSFKAATGEFTASTDNPSGLKLTYKSVTGYFKGKFTVYTKRSASAAKRYTANVTGFMVGDSGEGIATIKNVGTYPCKITYGTPE